MTKFLNISTDTTLGGASPSDEIVSSQKAIKTALDTKANSADLATVATSGSYNDLSNKPTIPTVNNPIITITQGGVTKGSFTLNQASGDTIALDAGGGGGSYTAGDGIDITNDVISVGDIDCGEISMPQKTVTFRVDNYVDFDNIIVNGVTYAQSVFGKVAGGESGSIMTLSLSFDIGTSIVWSITTNGDATPSSGSFVLNNDTTVNIVVYYGGGGEGGKE